MDIEDVAKWYYFQTLEEIKFDICGITGEP